MDERFVELAASMVERGQTVTLEALAREVGVSRSTAHRRTGGLAAVLQTLEARGIDSESLSARRRLLDAARTMVATRGLVGVTVEAIAAQANAGPVTVYRIFGDRESLLREALSDVFPADLLASAALETLPVERALRLLAEAVIRFAGTYPGLVAQMLLPASGDRAELLAVHHLQQDLRYRLIALFDRYSASGAFPAGDSPSRVGAFMGLCLGASLLLHEIRPLQEGDVAPRAEQVVCSFLRGQGLAQD